MHNLHFFMIVISVYKGETLSKCQCQVSLNTIVIDFINVTVGFYNRSIQKRYKCDNFMTWSSSLALISDKHACGKYAVCGSFKGLLLW